MLYNSNYLGLLELFTAKVLFNDRLQLFLNLKSN